MGERHLVAVGDLSYLCPTIVYICALIFMTNMSRSPTKEIHAEYPYRRLRPLAYQVGRFRIVKIHGEYEPVR